MFDANQRTYFSPVKINEFDLNHTLCNIEENLKNYKKLVLIELNAMASFQIHEDQENQVSNIRLKATKKGNFPQKRSALGTITLQSSNISQNASLKQVSII